MVPRPPGGVNHGSSRVSLDVMKPQAVRLADVFIIGPVMIASAVVVSRTGRRGLGAALGALGVATIAYNARNYSRRQELERTRRAANAGT